MGASVDMLLGGLTLGAAAAVGALVGGGAAWLGAAWKNRAAPSGATVVQLSDAMLEALLEAALLRYLAVVHARMPGATQDASGWADAVRSATRAHAAVLGPLWPALRAPTNAVRSAGPLAPEVESIATDVLARLHPAPARS
jgi:hypothetical protein